MPGRLSRSLASRMTLAVLLFSLALSVLSAAVLFAVYFRDEVAAVERDLEHVGQVNVPSISASLWIMDMQQLQIHVNALLTIPYVARVSIEDKGRVVAAAGAARPGRAIERAFALRYTMGEKTMNLGTLHVRASLAGISSDLFSKTFVRLTIQTGQIFLVAIFLLFLLRSIVTRRLSVLESHLGGLDAGRLDALLVLPRPQFFTGEDELDHAARAVNTMGANLRAAFSELETQRERLAVTLRSIGDGVITTDTQGRVTMMNLAAEQYTGWTQETATGKPLGEVFAIVDEATREPRDNPAAQVLRHERVVEMANHTALVRPDGSEIIIADSAAPIRRREGEIIGVVLVFRDVTERKRAEEALRQSEERYRRLNAGLEDRVRERTAQLEVTNKELEAFCYSVSHDLRAPLRAIEGFAGIVVEDYGVCLDAEGQRLLGVVRTNAMKMSQLIDDLLSFSRVGRSGLQRGRLAMGALARSAFGEIVTDPAAQARIDFTVGDMPAAEGDVALMRQVWFNLLANAVKFSGYKERPRIEVTGALAGKEAVYNVRDNGAGFDMQYAGKLFGVFQRLHAADQFEGTGIGLALVQRIVVRHGGRVWAQGEVGRGATFSFSLPAE